MKTMTDMIQLLMLGSNLIIDAGARSNDEIMQIAYMVNAHDSHLTLINASRKSMTDLVKVSELLGGNLTLDFSGPAAA